MHSQGLRNARSYEEKMEKKIGEGEKPDFHLAARVGWMNDPNGFSYYKGEYHMFYQYHPYDSHWGPMHWAHAVSKDLLHWTHLPAALAPDTDYDKDGCFSGSAVELPDGRQLLMYTGVRRETQPDGSTQEVQTQCLAVGDGVDYEKYVGNPVLAEQDLPEGYSPYDFRDPKMIKAADGSYRCLIAGCRGEKDGEILYYSSKDGFSWKRERSILANNGRLGKMWECPDMFELDGKAVLLLSAQDMLPQGFEYHNGNGTVCFIGTMETADTFGPMDAVEIMDTAKAIDAKDAIEVMDGGELFHEESNQAIDYGIDFYAPQTVLSPDGRRIMIGWMQNWDTSSQHPKTESWFGQMSLPRELSIKNGRLIQKPIRELEQLRENKVSYENVVFEGLLRLDGIEGRKVDMELEIAAADEETGYQKFAVRFAQNEIYHTSVSFRPGESIVKIDRKFSGSRRAIIHQRRCQLVTKKSSLKLRIILDRFSAEVFINDGEQVMSATIYTQQDAQGISFFADGKVEMSVVKYGLAC